MHEAFFPVCLLRDYPYALECLTCYGNFLLVGTKQGLLLIYELTPKVLTHDAFFVPPIASRITPKKPISLDLKNVSDALLGVGESAEYSGVSTSSVPAFSNRVHTTRTLGKKPILQLAAIPELDILLAVAEGKMNVYQLQNYQLITTVPNSRGASVFSHCLSNIRNNSGLYHPSCVVLVPTVETRDGISKREIDVETFSDLTGAAPALRVCVAVKRRLFLWRWHSTQQEFVKPGGTNDPISATCLPELNFSEEVRCVSFLDSTSVLVGMRSEYLLTSLISGETRPIANPGRNQLPLICRMPGCFRNPETELQLGQLFPSSTVIHSPDSRVGSVGRDTPSGSSSSPVPCTEELCPPLGLGRDDLLQVVSVVETPGALRQQIRWTSIPHQFHIYPPYIIGAMDKFLEVRVAESGELVQHLSIPRVQALCHYHGWLYAATGPVPTSSLPELKTAASSPDSPGISRVSSDIINSPKGKSLGSGNEIWLILSANRMNLVEQLIRHQEFDLAIRLAEVAPWTGQTPIETRTIAILQACHLYRQKAFAEALHIFTQQLIDPSHVLSLFPELVPESIRSQIQLPPGLELLGSEQCINACEPLITYLLTWRRVLRHALNMDRSHRPSCQSPHVHVAKSTTEVISVRCYPIQASSPCVSSVQGLLELIDTSLLKCYLSTNSARVGPLLRQANSCHLEESEKTLLAHHRYQDVVMLYQSHGIHRKALSVLQQLGMARLKQSGITVEVATNHSIDPPSIDPRNVDPNELSHLGHPRTIVRYFQSLGPGHFDLVLDYGDWVMRWFPFTWMHIFIPWERHLFSERHESGSVNQTEGKHDVKFFSRTYRGQVLKYLDKNAPHLVIPFLELLIFGRPDQEIDSDDEDDEDGTEDEVLGTAEGEKCREANSLVSRKNTTRFCENDRSEVRNSLWRLPVLSKLASSSGHEAITDPDKLPPIFKHMNDPDPVELHTSYAIALIDRIRSIQPPGKPLTGRVEEEQPSSGAVARLRRRLLRFLQHPDASYSSTKLFTKCPYDALFEERALVLANLKNHEQALTLWVHVLNDWDKAVSHCISVYEHNSQISGTSRTLTSLGVTSVVEKTSVASTVPIQPSLSGSVLTPLASYSPARDSLDGPVHNALSVTASADLISNVEQDIFFLLVLICLQPPEPTSLGIVLSTDAAAKSTETKNDTQPTFSSQPDRALEILKRFGDRVDAAKVIRILPGIRLSDVAHYLKATFFYQETLLTQLVFLRNAAQTEMIASRSELVRTTGSHFLVTPGARCRTCRRRIGNSAFARYPTTGELEHYGCCREYSTRR